MMQVPPPFSPISPLPNSALNPNTLSSSTNNVNNNNNNNNNNHNPNPNNSDVEYRVTVKQKKKQTAACDACKRRRRKCSGTLPCAYCTEKRCECNYSQQHKRGKRKTTDIPSPPEETQIVIPNLTKAQKLWNEAERYSTVDKFCGIRWWWKNLLDMQGIKQSPSPAFRAQSCIINAWMARVARDHIGARQYYDIARNISLNGFGDSDPVAITTAFLLLSDYAPSEKEYFHYSWKMAESIKPGTSTERHVYIYASSFQTFSYDKNTSYKQTFDKLLSFASTTLQSSVVDLWDTVYFMSVKAYIGLLSKLEHISADLLRDLSKLTLEKNDRDVLMTDLRVGEVLMQSQMHMFGFEYQTCLQFTKILLLWAGGEREKAVNESIRFVQNIEQYGENALFLVEVKNLMIPLMVLNEMGITSYNNTTVNIIETICKETDQPDMLSDLIPIFSELRLASNSHSRPVSSTNNQFLANTVISPLSTPSPTHSPLSSTPSPSNSPVSSGEEQDTLVYNPINEINTSTEFYLGFNPQPSFAPPPSQSDSAPPVKYNFIPGSHSSLYPSSSATPAILPYLSTSIAVQPMPSTNPRANPYLSTSTQLHSNSPHPLPQPISPPSASSSPSLSRVSHVDEEYVSHHNHPLSGAPTPSSISFPISQNHPLSTSAPSFVCYPLPPTRITYDLDWNSSPGFDSPAPSSSSSTSTPYSDLLSNN